MSISVYKGSELNRLARREVDRIDKNHRPLGQRASFGDWELVINDELAYPVLRVRYGVYEIRKREYIDGIRRPLVELSTEFTNIAL